MRIARALPVLAVFLAWAPTASALGPDVVVTSSADPGNGVCDSTCTLREAIETATVPTTFISFSPAVQGQTITLASPITIPVDVQVAGEDRGLTITGTANHMLFSVPSGKNLDMRDLTISGASATDAGEAGGGGNVIEATGLLELIRMKFLNNSGGDGGSGGNGGSGPSGGGGGGSVIAVKGADSNQLEIEDSTFTGNSGGDGGAGGPYAGGGAGGAVVATSNDDTRIHGSTFNGNFGGDGGDGANGGGGAAGGATIMSTGGVLIASSTFSGNTAGAGGDSQHGNAVSHDVGFHGTVGGAGGGGFGAGAGTNGVGSGGGGFFGNGGNGNSFGGGSGGGGGGDDNGQDAGDSAPLDGGDGGGPDAGTGGTGVGIDGDPDPSDHYGAGGGGAGGGGGGAGSADNADGGTGGFGGGAGAHSGSGTGGGGDSGDNGGGGGTGNGAIAMFAGHLDLQNSTIAGTANSAGGSITTSVGGEGDAGAAGAALYTHGSGTNATSTILADSTGGDDCVGAVTDDSAVVSNDLIESSEDCTVPDDTLDDDPGLAPLLDNGGATKTRAITASSPAFNTGANHENFLVDQRGDTFDRVAFGDPDIGAYELQPAQLRVVKALSPATDPGKFDLKIDGTTYATGVGNGGDTGFQTLVPGTHTVAEAAGAGTNLSDYTQSVACDNSVVVQVGGSVEIQPSTQVTCTITNTKPSGPTPSNPTNPTNPSNPTPPSNSITLGKLALNKKNGTGVLSVDVPADGELTVGGKDVAASKLVKKGTVKLTIRAKGKAKKTLNKKHKVTLTVKITFKPTGGTAKTQTKKVKLVKRR